MSVFWIFSCNTRAYGYKPEKGKISASTGPFFYASDVQHKPDLYFENPRLGWSFISEAVIGESSGLEIGLFYLNMPYLIEKASDEILIETIKRFYITTGYRHWWGENFSTALGIFSAYSMGDVKTVFRSPGLSSDTLTSAHDISEHGMSVSARYEHEFTREDGLVLDIRYFFSLTPEDDEKGNHYSLGISYIKRIKVK